MNLTDDEVLKFQRGSPVFLDDICAIYPAKMGEIVDEGYSNFQKYLSVLIAEKPVINKSDDSELKDLMEQLTDFQYLLMMTAVDPEINQTVKDAFRFFTHENIVFSLDPAQIIIGPIEEKHLLTEEKFYDLQRILKRMYFIEQEGEEIIISKDDPPAVRRLKEQMRRNREKVRKAKAKQAAQEGSDLKFSDLIGSITIDNCGLNMENVWNITYYAFHDQLKRMGWRDQFNINNQAALAGAKLKKNQLKHWMRSIASSDKS
jgi:hypothetical protein